LGGDCLNSGCVPSKALLKSARVAHMITKRAKEFGIEIEGEININFPQIMERMRRLRAEIAPHDSHEKVVSSGVDLFFGHAQFISQDTIEVDGKRLKFS